MISGTFNRRGQDSERLRRECTHLTLLSSIDVINKEMTYNFNNNNNANKMTTIAHKQRIETVCVILASLSK